MIKPDQELAEDILRVMDTSGSYLLYESCKNDTWDTKQEMDTTKALTAWLRRWLKAHPPERYYMRTTPLHLGVLTVLEHLGE